MRKAGKLLASMFLKCRVSNSSSDLQEPDNYDPSQCPIRMVPSNKYSCWLLKLTAEGQLRDQNNTLSSPFWIIGI